MEIRQLEGREELADVIRAHGLAWREAYRGVLPDHVVDQIPVEPTDQAIADWYERIRDDRDRFLVAVSGDAIRGYIYLRWGDETKDFVGANEAGLKEIYVHPDYWGQGIGTTLLEHGIDLLPDDIGALKLEMVSGNEIGKRFYEARGFERAGTSAFEIGNESYPMDIYAVQL